MEQRRESDQQFTHAFECCYCGQVGIIPGPDWYSAVDTAERIGWRLTSKHRYHMWQCPAHLDERTSQKP